MAKDIKILIVPDVHGRDFWRKPVMDNLDKEIVFLGDYVDPYPNEKITREKVFDVLLEILDLARENPNITLLLGNHDAGYAIDPEICWCRRDFMDYSRLSEVFKENLDLFDIAKEMSIANKRFIFSHAGIHFRSWIKYNRYIFKKGFRATAKNFNEMLHSDDPDVRLGFALALRDCSFHRGGIETYGSILWADICEFIGSKDLYATKRIQVVGHTILKEGNYVNLDNKFYCLDGRCVFYIDSTGTIRKYDDDEPLKVSGHNQDDSL